MRHKPIQNIRTRIHKNKLLVIIEFKNKEFVFLRPENIRQNTTIEVNELELLIDSTLRIDFYKKGDKMFNDKICSKDDILVKEYFFELAEPIEKLRESKKENLLAFKKIKEIFYFQKYGRENVGIKTEDDNVTFLSLKRFEIQSKLEKSEQHILIGSYIFPEYYKIGETLPNGKEVTANNKLLKWINLRYSERIDKMHQNFEENIAYYDGEDDYNPYDDYGTDEDFIRDVLDGDPSNYWNID